MEGDYEKAEHLIKRAIGIIKNDRDDKLSYASSINILAIVYDGQGKYHQAEPLFKQAVKIWEDKYGLNDTLFVAPTLERLAKMYKKLDRNEEIKIIEKRIRSIVTNDQKLTDLDIEVRELSNQGKYEEAVKKAEQSLILTEKIYGKNDISAALSMEKVAGLYEKLNNYSTAVFYNKKAHDIWVKERGADNIRAIRNLEYLAELYGKIGDDIEQNNVLKRLQEIKDQSKQP
jgi:tetratricopeptide (TPR) repeat protein